jgi:peptide chain release factor 1
MLNGIHLYYIAYILFYPILFYHHRDSADDGGAVLEVRAGTGGDEAALFAGELFKMYEKLTLRNGWTWELLSLSKTDIGGFKEASAMVTGDLVYKTLKVR